mmetsp:Transcript_10676/g.10550  ORF Transcript_10676/g.10550 Transcript_10676/m.10550 type:complete len:216 (-) Transcript_10676:2314-2961(-)
MRDFRWLEDLIIQSEACQGLVAMNFPQLVLNSNEIVSIALQNIMVILYIPAFRHFLFIVKILQCFSMGISISCTRHDCNMPSSAVGFFIREEDRVQPDRFMGPIPQPYHSWALYWGCIVEIPERNYINPHILSLIKANFGNLDDLLPIILDDKDWVNHLVSIYMRLVVNLLKIFSHKHLVVKMCGKVVVQSLWQPFLLIYVHDRTCNEKFECRVT